MRIFFCRHGETAFNEQRRWQGGAIDSPLTEKGLKQAGESADYLKGKGIEAIYTSTIGRAKKSASFLRKHFPNARYEELECLKELENGEAEGMPFEESMEKFPDAMGRIRQNDSEAKFPKGESYADGMKRMKAFAERLEKGHEKAVALVSHGGTSKILIGLLLSMAGSELMRISAPNDVIYEVDLPEKKAFHIRAGKREEGLLFRN